MAAKDPNQKPRSEWCKCPPNKQEFDRFGKGTCRNCCKKIYVELKFTGKVK